VTLDSAIIENTTKIQIVTSLAYELLNILYHKFSDGNGSNSRSAPMQIGPENSQIPFSPSTPHSARLLAEHLFRDLKSQGFKDKEIVALSSELLNQLSKDLASRRTQKAS
jgi:hypothetical protein